MSSRFPEHFQTNASELLEKFAAEIWILMFINGSTSYLHGILHGILWLFSSD